MKEKEIRNILEKALSKAYENSLVCMITMNGETEDYYVKEIHLNRNLLVCPPIPQYGYVLINLTTKERKHCHIDDITKAEIRLDKINNEVLTKAFKEGLEIKVSLTNKDIYVGTIDTAMITENMVEHIILNVSSGGIYKYIPYEKILRVKELFKENK